MDLISSDDNHDTITLPVDSNGKLTLKVTPLELQEIRYALAFVEKRREVSRQSYYTKQRKINLNDKIIEMHNRKLKPTEISVIRGNDTKITDNAILSTDNQNIIIKKQVKKPVNLTIIDNI